MRGGSRCEVAPPGKFKGEKAKRRTNNLCQLGISLTMTIQATQAPHLPLGPNHVKVTQVEEGLTSEYQGTPYLNVHLNNDNGVLEHRVYLSDKAQPLLADFLQALGLDPTAEHDPQDFVGRELLVDVEEDTYQAPDTGNERTIRRATHFRPAGESA